MWKRINEKMIFKRTLPQQLESYYLDLRYGGKLLDDEKFSPYFKEGCYHTQSVEYEELKKIFDRLKLKSSDTIMDVGCGRGRLFNFLLRNKFSGKMYGAEIDPEIGQFTKDRLKNYGNIYIFIGNALNFVFPEVTVYFMFCPFDRKMTEKFIKEVEKKHKEVNIVYYYPKFVYCILSREGWTGEEIIIYSSIRKFSLPCYYLRYKCSN